MAMLAHAHVAKQSVIAMLDAWSQVESGSARPFRLRSTFAQEPSVVEAASRAFGESG